MNKEEYILSEEFEAELENGELIVPKAVKKKLSEINSKTVLVAVYKNIKSDLEKFSIDKDLFYVIEKKQRIPANVVLDFLCVKGEIHDEDFFKRLKSV